MTRALPRNIFGYLHQGRDKAPDDIKQCWDLWARMNLGWEVKILEWADVKKQITDWGVTASNMSFTSISNIVRLSSLSAQRGI